MWQVEYDQAAALSRKCHGELPRDHATPVVADNGGLFRPDVFDDCGHVTDQQLEVVLLDPLRLVAAVVAPHVDRRDLEVVGQGCHLVPPRVPVVGEAVDHHHQWALPERDVVDLDSVAVRVSVSDPIVQGVVGFGSGRDSEYEQQDELGGELACHGQAVEWRFPNAGRSARALSLGRNRPATADDDRRLNTDIRPCRRWCHEIGSVRGIGHSRRRLVNVTVAGPILLH